MSASAERPGPAIVLETKLHPPSSRPGLVERAGLLQRLLDAQASVVVVGAPAGYGKTILLAQYAAVADRPFAWLSLDATDADPVLLALDLATSIHRVSEVDARVFSSLSTPAPAIRRVVLPGLVNSLNSANVTLALDDLHLVEDARSLAIVSFLCEHLAPEAKLLVASRDTSALPLGSLRVRGQLLELGWRDLALNRSEVEGLMRAVGASFAEEDLNAVLERTEGWPAAVYLSRSRSGTLARAPPRRSGWPAMIAISWITSPRSCSCVCRPSGSPSSCGHPS